MSLLFTGVSAAVTTPFVNGELDLDSFEKHLTFLKENNLQAFVINGTTAESPTLTDEEKELTLKTAVKVANGEIPYENIENMFRGWMGSFYKLLSRQQRKKLITLYEDLFDKTLSIVVKNLVIFDKEE